MSILEPGLHIHADGHDPARTVAIRQARVDLPMWTPVIIYEEDDGSITVSVVPEITIKVVRRDLP